MLHFGMPSLKLAIDEALRLSIATRIKTAAGAKATAEAFADRGRTVEAIETFQKAGFFDNALRLFEAAGGNFFLIISGQRPLKVLAGFPRTYAMQSEELVLSHALQALKQARCIACAPVACRPVRRIGKRPCDDFFKQVLPVREFRAFRLVMLLYEDYFFSEELPDRAYALMAEFLIDDHLFRGSFSNSVLEFYIRNRRFAEAEDVGTARHVPLSAGEIADAGVLYQPAPGCDPASMGDALTARKHAALSAASLECHRLRQP